MANKLFVGQIPKHMGEEQLTPMFQTYGNIVELSVIRDKMTNVHRGMLFSVLHLSSILSLFYLCKLMDYLLLIWLSTGCAFLTYSTKEEADACIAALHNKHTLQSVCYHFSLPSSPSSLYLYLFISFPHFIPSPRSTSLNC
jgi:CUG-BP- and ETR3-like factor